MRRLLQSLFGKSPPADAAATTLVGGLPFEVIQVPGAEAEATRERLLGRGVVPVIVGDMDEAERLFEPVLEEGRPDVEAVLKRAARLDVEAWTRERRAEASSLLGVVPSLWPSHPPPPRHLTVPREPLGGRFRPQVLLALVPADQSWQVPAYLHYGGFESCPSAHVHVALLRHWQRAYGAELACLQAATLECKVERPPSTREAALELVEQQIAYCPAIAQQGAQSVEALAGILLTARTWHFSWD